MSLSILSFVAIVVLSSASPVYPIPLPERAASLDSAKSASDVTYIRRDIAKDAANSNAGATGSPSNMSATFAVMSPDSVVGHPVANAAFWQEALDFDAQRNSGKANQNVYQQLAFLQLNENASLTFTSIAEPDALQMSSLISRTLQYSNIYPGQVNRPQAAFPAETLSEYY